MINQCIEYNGKQLLSLRYDVEEILQRAIERTQFVANNMRDSQGNDMYETMSATEDDNIMLHRYIDEAWQSVIDSSRAYWKCVPTCPDADSFTSYYTIVLLFPPTWDVANAITIDHAIHDYMLSRVVQSWWIGKGVAEQAGVEESRIDRCMREIKYSLHNRKTSNGLREGRYF